MRPIYLFRGLGSRMALACFGLILVVLLVLAAVLPGIVRGQAIAVLDDRLLVEAQLVADSVVSELNNRQDADLGAVAKRLGQNGPGWLTIFGADGSVLGDSRSDPGRAEKGPNRKEVQAALAGDRGVDLRYSQADGYEVIYAAVPIIRAGANIGVSSVAFPLTEIDRLVADLINAILLVAIAGGLLAIVLGLAGGRWIAGSLARLTRVASALADDPAGASGLWLARGPTEVVRLGETLERMAKAVSESLRRVGAERDRLDAVLASMADGIVIVNADGRVRRVNKAAERLLQVPKDTPTGRTAAEVLRDHELVALVGEVQRSDAALATRFLEWRNPRRFLRATASRFGLGEAGQTLLVVHDLTELRRLETIRRDFVANVSHELRTPIAAIKAMAETLEDGAIDDPAAARDFVARIEQEADGMHRLVEELLELSRLESGRAGVVPTPVDPAALLDSAVRRLGTMADRAKVTLSVDAPPDLPRVMVDSERMSQVLVNLIHNAIKFTPPCGAIVVRAAREEDRVRLSVSDTGVGLAPELLPRIFERFYKADQARAGGGTGLGLAIAKHTVLLHSGEIWAESEGPGRGTTIHVTLPLAPVSQSNSD